jgi:hypothetical protein
MWLLVSSVGSAYNLAQFSRLRVDEIGARAAISGDLAGKSVPLAFFDTRAEALLALTAIFDQLAAGVPVVRL